MCPLVLRVHGIHLYEIHRCTWLIPRDLCASLQVTTVRNTPKTGRANDMENGGSFRIPCHSILLFGKPQHHLRGDDWPSSVGDLRECVDDGFICCRVVGSPFGDNDAFVSGRVWHLEHSLFFLSFGDWSSISKSYASRKQSVFLMITGASGDVVRGHGVSSRGSTPFQPSITPFQPSISRGKA